ncbi:MAG: hypothetical protein ACK2UK_02665 [Candidatus Promineifilaceae bacterium]
MKRMLAGFFFKSGLLRRRAFALRSFLLVLILVLTALPAVAQEQADPEPQVQIQTGQIFAGERMYYLLPGLRQGDRLYARMSNASGNLDPLLLLARPGAITAESLAKMRADLDARTAAGEDSVLALREVLTANFLAGNDNYGAGATAAFGYEVPEDGDYLLLALGSLIHETAGAYELVIGLNAPQILDDPAVKDSGAEIAMLDKEASGIDTAVQEIHGALPAGTPQWFYTIPRLEAGDTLYVFVEPLAGDFIPVLRLQDYSGRPLREENSAGQASTAGFQYPVAAQNKNFRIVVEDWQAANAGADAVGADLAPAQTAEPPPSVSPTCRPERAVRSRRHGHAVRPSVRHRFAARYRARGTGANHGCGPDRRELRRRLLPADGLARSVASVRSR